MTFQKRYHVYMMMNPRRTVLYIGSTSNLRNRVQQHRVKALPGFAARYNAIDLVYYEELPNAYDMVNRERQLKGWRREKKLVLAKDVNPELKNLFDEFE